MFERYTEPARRTLFFARYEASQLGSISIAAEHLLLGLIREDKGATGRIFADADVSLDNVRQDIEARMTARGKGDASAEIPFSAEAKRALQFAADEADGLLHNHIGPEHLLLGLLREEKSLAASILRKNGIGLSGVRSQVSAMFHTPQTVPGDRADIVKELEHVKTLVDRLADGLSDQQRVLEQIRFLLDHLQERLRS